MTAKDGFPLAVSRVLWDVWDPIGVNQFRQAKGEYDAYVPIIVRMLRQGTTEEELAAHLRDIETVSMGLGKGMSTRAAAKALLALPVTWPEDHGPSR